MAIEIEKKFLLDEAAREQLLASAEFVGTKIFTDTYYDNATYDLARKDAWLRLRDNNWELKIPLHGGLDRTVEQYEELETETEIADYLKLPKDKPLTDVLADNGFKALGSFTTTRSKYKKGKFGIDLDSVDFGYDIAEIELMVEDGSNVEEASESLLRFASEMGLKADTKRGKLIEYLWRNDRNVFDLLVEAGIFSP